MRIKVGEYTYGISYRYDRYAKESIGVSIGRMVEIASTACIIEAIYTVDEKEQPVFVGRGNACCSVKDHFQYTVGRKIALTRALRVAFPDKPLRTEAWAAIWEARKHLTQKPWSV